RRRWACGGDHDGYQTIRVITHHAGFGFIRTSASSSRLRPGDHASRFRFGATEQDAVVEHVVEVEDEDIRRGCAAPPLRPAQIKDLFHALAEERAGRQHTRHRRAGKPQSGLNRERLATPFRVHDLGARNDQPPAQRPQALPSFKHDGERVLAQLKLHSLRGSDAANPRTTSRLSRVAKAARSSGTSPSSMQASSNSSAARSLASSVRECACAVPRAATSGWRMLSSRIGFEPAPPLWRASRRSNSRSGPLPPATRQAALSVKRCEARTSETRSPSAAFTAAMTLASSAPSGFGASSAFVSASSLGTRPKSTSPWLSDLSGLPSKPSGSAVQNASTGSVSSSTSMPRARAASSFGLDLRRSALSPTR